MDNNTPEHAAARLEEEVNTLITYVNTSDRAVKVKHQLQKCTELFEVYKASTTELDATLLTSADESATRSAVSHYTPHRKDDNY